MRAPAAATRILTVLVVMSLWGVQAAEAVNASAPPERPSGELVVGTFQVPPFAMRDSGGSWSGIAIELWREVAGRQGISYRLEEHDLQSLLAAVETGRVDVAVGPLLITADRERLMDLTSPFMHVALAIGTRPETGWWAALRSVLSGPLLWATLGLAVLLLVFAALVWLLERHRNPEHFGGARMRGLGDAIWWSASTMSTVGYGDRTPVTFWGRTTGIVWMFVSIVLVSAFIALVTSAVTVQQLQTQIRSIADLARVRVAAVSGSGSAEYLRDLGIIAVSCETVRACLDALVAGDVDAVVEEWPVLQWEARHRYPGRLAIVPQPFARGFIGFALPRDSPRRRALNVTLLQVLDDPAWQEISRTYLGGASGEGSGLVSARAP
jgi:polar amino acid transport system substrate-binding protein